MTFTASRTVRADGPGGGEGCPSREYSKRSKTLHSHIETQHPERFLWNAPACFAVWIHLNSKVFMELIRKSPAGADVCPRL